MVHSDFRVCVEIDLSNPGFIGYLSTVPFVKEALEVFRN